MCTDANKKICFAASLKNRAIVAGNINAATSFEFSAELMIAQKRMKRIGNKQADSIIRLLL